MAFKVVRARVFPPIFTADSATTGMDPQTITAPVVCSFAGHEWVSLNLLTPRITS